MHFILFPISEKIAIERNKCFLTWLLEKSGVVSAIQTSKLVYLPPPLVSYKYTFNIFPVESKQ